MQIEAAVIFLLTFKNKTIKYVAGYIMEVIRLRHAVGFLMKQISDKVKVSVDASLKSQNITLSQYRVLKYIADSKTSVTQKSIGNYLNVSHPTVVGIISRMEKKGYLRSYTDDGDRRNKIVEMTGQAAQITREVQREVEAQEEKW